MAVRKKKVVVTWSAAPKKKAGPPRARIEPAPSMSENSELVLAEGRFEHAKDRFQVLEQRFRVVEREVDELRRRFMSLVFDQDDARPKTSRKLGELRIDADLDVVWKCEQSEFAALEEEYGDRRDAIRRRFLADEHEVRRRHAPESAEFDGDGQESGQDQVSGLIENSEVLKFRPDPGAALGVSESVRSDRILARRGMNAARGARKAVRER